MDALTRSTAERTAEELAAARRVAAVAASLVAFLSVQGILGLEPSIFVAIVGAVALPALVGRWTEGVVAPVGAAAISIRAHIPFWLVFGLVTIAAVGGTLSGASSRDLDPWVSFFLFWLVLAGFGLSGPRSYRFHGILSFLLLFVGLGRGGNERFLWWGAYACAMSCLLAAGHLHQRAHRFRFEEPGTVLRSLSLGATGAALYLILLAGAIAIGPRTERGGAFDDFGPAVREEVGEDEPGPVRLLLSVVVLMGLVVASAKLLEWLRSKKTKATGAPEERSLVARVERVGAATTAEAKMPRPRTDRERVVHVYLSWCRDLGSLGWPRRPWMTPDEFAERIEGTCPEAGPAGRDLTRLFQVACYSNRPVGREELRSAEELARASRGLLAVKKRMKEGGEGTCKREKD
ncbi:MAG: DUF4129 domain-containing protein [Planctomycetes bacterium]|nr:DUF4129 domain-containing protein [Planctomycetota bacterium]